MGGTCLGARDDEFLETFNADDVIGDESELIPKLQRLAAIDGAISRSGFDWRRGARAKDSKVPQNAAV